MTGDLIKRVKLETRRMHTESKPREHTGKDGHLQAKERDLDQILPSWPSEGTNPADTP